MLNTFRKLFAATALLFATGIAFADELALIVELNNGSKCSFVLKDKPVVTYSGDTMLINGNLSTSYPWKTLNKVHFDEAITDLNDLSANEVRIVYVDNQSVRIMGLKPNTSLSLYSISGAVIQRYEAVGDNCDILLPNQPGVYMLNDGTSTYKIVKQ